MSVDRAGRDLASLTINWIVLRLETCGRRSAGSGDPRTARDQRPVHSEARRAIFPTTDMDVRRTGALHHPVARAAPLYADGVVSHSPELVAGGLPMATYPGYIAK